jgi:hydrogenase expression/formation protein HypE
LTNKLLEQGVFSLLSNDLLDRQHDGAIFKANGDLAFSTDSFVVSPIFFKGGNIGDLAVHGTVNDVAMCGAIPQFISLAFIVEEGLDTEEFKKVIQSVKKAAIESNVQVITGDTKVVERGKGDKLFINTTGFGPVHPKAQVSYKRIKADDQIIISGRIAQHGMAIMSQREGLEFESTILSDTTNLNFLTTALLDRWGEQIHLFRDPTRGGVASVLSEIAIDTGLGININESDLPLEKQVAAACEILGIDPLYVANEGVFITMVDREVAPAVLDYLRSTHKGSHAACIGSFTTDHPGKVVMTSLIGGRRMVTPLLGEQLPRIC